MTLKYIHKTLSCSTNNLEKDSPIRMNTVTEKFKGGAKLPNGRII